MLRGYVGDLAAGALIDAEATAAVLDAEGWVTTGRPRGGRATTATCAWSGRVSEMYIRGGYNVYPAEVEAVLGELPACGPGGGGGGARPRAGRDRRGLRRARGRARRPSLDDLRAACRARLADYKAPDRLYLVEELPVTPMAKIDKRELAARAAELETRRVKERVST